MTGEHEQVRIPRLEWVPVDHGEQRLGSELDRGISLSNLAWYRNSIQHLRAWHHDADVSRAREAAVDAFHQLQPLLAGEQAPGIDERATAIAADVLDKLGIGKDASVVTWHVVHRAAIAAAKEAFQQNGHTQPPDTESAKEQGEGYYD